MPQNRPVAAPRDLRYAYLPFFEVYFPNFIEGTEFELDEAVALVYGGKQVPDTRMTATTCSAPTRSSPTQPR
jgi:hypothetical protein